jgi:hypothetical protein
VKGSQDEGFEKGLPIQLRVLERPQRLGAVDDSSLGAPAYFVNRIPPSAQSKNRVDTDEARKQADARTFAQVFRRK